jgi:hypothetical protein
MVDTRGGLSAERGLPDTAPLLKDKAVTAQRAASMRYRASPKGKAAAARYRVSAKGKATHARWRASLQGKASIARYRKSDKGKAAIARYEASAATERLTSTRKRVLGIGHPARARRSRLGTECLPRAGQCRHITGPLLRAR